jgi:hypothetical protein
MLNLIARLGQLWSSILHARKNHSKRQLMKILLINNQIWSGLHYFCPTIKNYCTSSSSTLLYKPCQSTHLGIPFSILLFFHLGLAFVLDRDKSIFVLSSSIGKVSRSKQGARLQDSVSSQVARNGLYFLFSFNFIRDVYFCICSF